MWPGVGIGERSMVGVVVVVRVGVIIGIRVIGVWVEVWVAVIVGVGFSCRVGSLLLVALVFLLMLRDMGTAYNGHQGQPHHQTLHYGLQEPDCPRPC